MRKYPKSV